MDPNRDLVALGWAGDFIRAAVERPLWARLLFRMAVGRYAYREFIGMIHVLRNDGHYFNIGYGLEKGDWHKDHTPLDWRKAAWATPEDLTQP